MTDRKRRKAKAPPGTPPASEQPGEWPLPTGKGKKAGVNDGLAWSSVAAPNLGMASLGLGSGAFGHKYRKTKK
jgi:hypothetical protein